MTDPLLEAALMYAARGWPVLPLHSIRPGGGCTCPENADCGSPGKHPRTRAGLHDATTDPELVRLWWTGAHKGANIGLRTGVCFDVLDDDSDGFQAWEDLTALHAGDHADLFPTGWAVLTGGGGLHIYVAPTGLGNRARFLPHLDWRGQGGYVVAPPSVHRSGQPYTWAAAG